MKTLLLATTLFIILVPFASAQEVETDKPSVAKAIAKIRAGNIDAAEKILKRILIEEPKHVAALGNLGRIYKMTNRDQEAIESFKKLLSIRPEDAPADAELCELYAQRGDTTLALKHCRSAKSKDSENQLVKEIDEFVSFISNTTEGGFERNLREALRNHPENIRLNVLGAEYFEGIDKEYSIDLYERLKRLVPGNPISRMRLATLYIEVGRRSDALYEAENVVKEFPELAMARDVVGHVYLELGLNREAADSFKILTELEPDGDRALFFLGVSHMRLGAYSKAAEVLKSAVNKKPDSWDYRSELATALGYAKRPSEAIKILELMSSERPQDINVLVRLAFSYNSARRYNDAISTMRNATALRPLPEVYTQISRIAAARLDYVNRLDEMKAELEQSPNDPTLLTVISQTLGYAGKFEEAKVYAERMTALDLKTSKNLIYIAIFYDDHGDYETAERLYKRAIAIDKSPGAYVSLSRYAELRGNIEEAHKHWKSFFKIKPDAPGFLGIYASFLEKHGKQEDALKAYQRILEIQPNNPKALFGAGANALRMRQYDAAKVYLERLQQLDRNLAEKLRVYTQYITRRR